ncbi:MAG: hypothetical protein IJ094_02615 [Bacilli bacterium]|nr:hypothetical protein [Bacilli bacterium]
MEELKITIEVLKSRLDKHIGENMSPDILVATKETCITINTIRNRYIELS